MKDKFASPLPYLDEEVSALLETYITENEVGKAIEELRPGKTPGPDGLGAALDKKFKECRSPVFRRVYT